MIGAAAWLLYGVVESALLVSVAGAKNLLAAAAPGLHAAGNPDFLSAAMGAVTLAVYAVAGALLCAAIALLLVFLPAGRRALARADPEALWSAIAALSVVLAFAAHALGTTPAIAPALVVPFGLGLARLAAASRPRARERWIRATHPLWIFLVLLGAALLAGRRDTGLVSIGLAMAWTGGVLFAAMTWGPPLGRIPAPALIAGLASVIVAATPLARVAALRSRPQPRAAAADARPDVILIVLDTVRADHLSVYGYGRDTTPTLRAAADRGATVYTHATVPSNWTLPSVASILTGQTPWRHGAEISAEHPEGVGISAASPLLAETLSRAGYRTAAVVANPLLDPEFGFDRGVASYEFVPAENVFTPLSRPFLLRQAVRNLAAASLPFAPPDDEAADAAAVNRMAVRALRSMAAVHGPFYLFLNYMDAHAPYLPPPPFDTRYPGKDPAFRWPAWGSRPLTPREREHAISQYDGALAYLDHELGALFGTLDALGRSDNSLVVVIGDHGEAFDDHGVVGHGVSLYQTQIRVPLIVKYPHAPAGGRVDAPVSALDVVPTVLEAAGVPAPADADGRSLRRPNNSAPRWIVSESSQGRGFVYRGALAPPVEVALSAGTMKLILGTGRGEELYDVAADPDERINLTGRRAVPEAWRAVLGAFREQPLPSTALFVDPALRERLRALGYVRGAPR